MTVAERASRARPSSSSTSAKRRPSSQCLHRDKEDRTRVQGGVAVTCDKQGIRLAQAGPGHRKRRRTHTHTSTDYGGAVFVTSELIAANGPSIRWRRPVNDSLLTTRFREDVDVELPHRGEMQCGSHCIFWRSTTLCTYGHFIRTFGPSLSKIQLAIIVNKETCLYIIDKI